MEDEVKKSIEFVKEYGKRTVGWLILIFIIFIISFIKNSSMIESQKKEIATLNAKIEKLESQATKNNETIFAIMPIINGIHGILKAQTSSIKDLKNMAEIQLLSRGTPDYDQPAIEEEQSSSSEPGKTIILDSLDKKTLEKLKAYYIDNKSQLLNDNIAPNSNANYSDSVQPNQPK